MKERIRDYFKDLYCKASVSGSEQEVIRYMKEKLEPVADEVKVDNNGNVIAIKRGKTQGPKLMIAAHADEIGFCVKNILKDGFILFDKVGTAPDKVLEGRKVFINNKIPGIIGIKPGHLQTPEESKKVKSAKECYIDIGMSSKEEAESLGIKIGDPIVFESSFMEMTNRDLICTKSVDNRINCALLIELFNQIRDLDFAGTIYGVVTVQEETGMRGAFMAGNAIEPDYAIVIDTIPAGDTPDIDSDKVLPIYLGKGPACPLAEGVAVGLLYSFIHPKIKEIIAEQSEKSGVNIQYVTLMGDFYATDAARLNMAGKGIPFGTLAIPRRYSHSPVELVNLNDAVGSLQVLINIVKENGYKSLSFI